MEFSETESRVLRYLEQRFLAGGVQRAVAPADISRDNGIEQLENLRLVARLKTLGVLETISDDGDCWINDAICQQVAELNQGSAASQSPASIVNVNYMHIEQVSHSQIQQGTERSTQILSQEGTADKPRQAEVSLDISVFSEPPKSWRHGDDTIVAYNLERNDRGIRIQPTMGYLSRCEAGGPIEALNYYTGKVAPFCWDFPQLDFKVLNNSPNTIYLTELILDVEESILDPFPIIAIKADVLGRYVGHFLLFNEGWCDLQDVTVRYALLPGELETAPTVGEHPFVCTVGTVSHSEKVWILDAFRQMGVDTGGLERLSNAEAVDDEHLTVTDENGVATTITKDEYERRCQECLGPFQDGVGTAFGEIDFTASAIDGNASRRTIAFRTPVCLFNMNRCGVPKPSSYEYQARFEVGMSGYQRRVSLSQEVKSGETDRFSAKIAVKKSSLHRFRATVRDIQGNQFQFPAIEMTIFVPRSAEARVNNFLSQEVVSQPVPIPIEVIYG